VDHITRSQPVRRKRPFRWRWVLLLLVLGYAATGIYMVQPDERAVVQRCGKVLPGLQTPGLHFGFPYGIDRVTRLKMSETRRVTVPKGSGVVEPQQAECLTGDRNLIRVSAVVEYRIADTSAYLFRTADVSALVAHAAEASLHWTVGSMAADDVPALKRVEIPGRVKRLTQAALDRYGMGVEVTGVWLDAVAPPRDIVAAFDDVFAAQADRQRKIDEAKDYAARLALQSKSEAEQTRVKAEAFKAEAVATARGDADRFLAVAAKLSGDRNLAARRLILETLEEVLPRVKKVFIDSNADQPLDLEILEAEP